MTTRQRLERTATVLETRQRWEPWPHQIAPPEWLDPASNVDTFVLSGGRDTGKTYAGAGHFTDHIHGPPCFPDGPQPHRTIIAAPTLDHARDACIYDGLQHHNTTDALHLVGGDRGRKIRWVNNAETYLISGETRRDVDHVRGPGSNACFAWIDETAAIPKLDYLATQMAYAVRSGPNPRFIATTTPRPRAAYIEWVQRPNVVAVRASVEDNRLRMATKAGRRRIARLRAAAADPKRRAHAAAELDGILGAPDPRALFSADTIDTNRLLTVPDNFTVTETIAVIDPADGGDTTGLVAAMTLPSCWCGNPAPLPHFAIVDDATTTISLDRGMPRAVRFARYWRVDAAVVESNGIGGRGIRLLTLLDPLLPIVTVNARETKAARAEPVALLYSAGRVHHIGDPATFASLELEQTTWVPPEARTDVDDDDEFESPGRLDAAVYAITHLAGLSGEGQYWI